MSPGRGHTRLLAAQAAGITEIPVVWKSFTSEDEAVAYSIHAQRDRRNILEADIQRWAVELDKRRQHGGDRKSKEAQKIKCSSEHLKSTREEIAKQIGTSPIKIQKALTVHDHAPELEAQVLDGADVLRWVGELDKRSKPGPKTDNLASSEANFGKSADRTAETIGTSRAKVEKERKQRGGDRKSEEAKSMGTSVPIDRSAEGKAKFPHENIARSHVETAKTVGASEGKRA